MKFRGLERDGQCQEHFQKNVVQFLNTHTFDPNPLTQVPGGLTPFSDLCGSYAWT